MMDKLRVAWEYLIRGGVSALAGPGRLSAKTLTVVDCGRPAAVASPLAIARHGRRGAVYLLLML
jgi:hypothetical protein